LCSKTLAWKCSSGPTSAKLRRRKANCAKDHIETAPRSIERPQRPCERLTHGLVGARFLFIFEPQAVVPTTLAVEEDAADDSVDADAVAAANDAVVAAPRAD
jgi:hypothetical protein